jgi:hypothetical protein
VKGLKRSPLVNQKRKPLKKPYKANTLDPVLERVKEIIMAFIMHPMV